MSEFDDDEPPASRECFVFVAAIPQGERVTALVARRGMLYHVALRGAASGSSDLQTSAAAYLRALPTDSTDAEPPSLDVALGGASAVSVQLVVFAHQSGRGRGRPAERASMDTMWTALLGAGPAAALRDGRRRRSVAQSGRNGIVGGAEGDAESYDSEGGRAPGAAAGTVAAYLDGVPSCYGRAIVLTAPMYAAARSNGALSGREKVKKGAPLGTSIIRPKCPDDADAREDADAEIPAWEWTAGSTQVPASGRSTRSAGPPPAPARATVSATSVMAYFLGLIAAPTVAEFDYSQRQLTDAGSVPMAAVRRRARALGGADPALSDVKVLPPPVSRGIVTAVSVDVDLLEEHMRAVTTSSAVIRRALRVAAKLFTGELPATPRDDACASGLRQLDSALSGCVVRPATCGGKSAGQPRHSTPCCCSLAGTPLFRRCPTTTRHGC